MSMPAAFVILKVLLDSQDRFLDQDRGLLQQTLLPPTAIELGIGLELAPHVLVGHDHLLLIFTRPARAEPTA